MTRHNVFSISVFIFFVEDYDRNWSGVYVFDKTVMINSCLHCLFCFPLELITAQTWNFYLYEMKYITFAKFVLRKLLFKP